MDALTERAQAWLDRTKDMADFPGQAAPRELVTLLIREITALEARIEALERERDELLCGLMNRGDEAKRRVAALAAEEKP